MGKCRAYYDLISSILFVLFSTAAFITFWVYGNIQAATWAAFAGNVRAYLGSLIVPVFAFLIKYVSFRRHFFSNMPPVTYTLLD